MTKTLILTAAFAGVTATSTLAGGMAEPVMEQAVIVEDMGTPSSSSQMLPVIIFALLVAVANS